MLEFFQLVQQIGDDSLTPFGVEMTAVIAIFISEPVGIGSLFDPLVSCRNRPLRSADFGIDRSFIPATAGLKNQPARQMLFVSCRYLIKFFNQSIEKLFISLTRHFAFPIRFALMPEHKI